MTATVPLTSWQFAAAVALPMLAGSAVTALPRVGTASVQKDYASTAKPVWSPPPWLFGVVWPILYALMGAASFLVWNDEKATKEARRAALGLYAAQLVLNLVWSPVYFGLGARAAALGILLLLDVVVALTILAFARVNPTAAWLMAPYAAWLAVATALNASVVAMN